MFQVLSALGRLAIRGPKWQALWLFPNSNLYNEETSSAKTDEVPEMHEGRSELLLFSNAQFVLGDFTIESRSTDLESLRRFGDIASGDFECAND